MQKALAVLQKKSAVRAEVLRLVHAIMYMIDWLTKYLYMYNKCISKM